MDIDKVIGSILSIQDYYDFVRAAVRFSKKYDQTTFYEALLENQNHFYILVNKINEYGYVENDIRAILYVPKTKAEFLQNVEKLGFIIPSNILQRFKSSSWTEDYQNRVMRALCSIHTIYDRDSSIIKSITNTNKDCECSEE
ncbi:MAG: hypothetical protein ACK4NC_00140 [Candidatus Gracilibacteria bacterium]